ncbi:MAG: hypothetical protein H6Q38_1085 [Chloroflexi bacterium]|jgi:hypothetical protein|nr:hypothetical protein [Chloroflexota bacterium]
MVADARVVLYGNSVFLAGIKTELQRYEALDLRTVEVSCPDARELIRAFNPHALLFDLAAAQPDFAVALLRERPDLLLIGVDPTCDELLVLSSHPQQALAVSDIVKVIHLEGGRAVEIGRQGEGERRGGEELISIMQESSSDEFNKRDSDKGVSNN